MCPVQPRHRAVGPVAGGGAIWQTDELRVPAVVWLRTVLAFAFAYPRAGPRDNKQPTCITVLLRAGKYAAGVPVVNAKDVGNAIAC